MFLTKSPTSSIWSTPGFTGQGSGGLAPCRSSGRSCRATKDGFYRRSPPPCACRRQSGRAFGRARRRPSSPSAHHAKWREIGSHRQHDGGAALQTFGQIQRIPPVAHRRTDVQVDELRKSVEAAERKVEGFRASHDLVAQGHLISDDEMPNSTNSSPSPVPALELFVVCSLDEFGSERHLAGEINSNTMSDLRSQCDAQAGSRPRRGRLGRVIPNSCSAPSLPARERIAAIAPHRLVAAARPETRRPARTGPGFASGAGEGP